MENSIIEKERAYCREYSALTEKMITLYNELILDENVSLEGIDISLAVLERLVMYYTYQNAVKVFLNKRYATAGADFFVETVIFYLKLLIKKFAPEYQIESERSIERKRGSIKPDISIWKDNEVIAIIECKTQLGWNRLGWEDDFLNREAKLKSIFPKANAFLFVMSLSNWAGFGDSENVGIKYFVLSETWPGDIDAVNSKSVVNTVEMLFKRIFDIGNR